MATNTFSFEDAIGPTARGNLSFVPADRTSERKEFSETPVIGKAAAGVAGALPKDSGILSAIKSAAEQYGVPLEYGLALAQQESGYNPNARNSEFGADGLFQFIPSTAKGHGLEYGVDTRNATKASIAAMKDFSEQMAVGGVEWAIKHHFAGPNVKGHGKKTRQYLADVTKRANDIRGLIDANPELADAIEDSTGIDVSGSSDIAVKQSASGTFSFEDGLGGDRTPPKPEPKSLVDRAKSMIATGATVAAEKADASWEHVKNRFLTDMGRIPEDDPRYSPTLTQSQIGKDPYAEVRDTAARIAKRKDEAAKAGQPTQAGFLNNIDNPVKLLTEDSLPANFIEGLIRAPAQEREAFMNARKVTMQENIVAHPEKFPAVSVEAAKAAIAERAAKQKPGVAQMWNDLKAAAKEDPGRFAAQFANALIADPEMLLAPEGIGFKIAAGTKRLATGAEVTSKALKVADRIVDAGTTGAALNLGIEAAKASSEGTTMSGSDVAFSAGLGFAASGAMAALFARGARARDQLATKDVNADTLQGILRDVANEELALEQVIDNPTSVPTKVRDSIEESLGIKNMTDAEKKKWHTQRQRELKKTFEEQSLDADYYKFKAEERIQRTTQIAEEAAAREARSVADAAEQHATQTELAERQATRTARFASEYEQAVRARDQAEMSNTQQAAAQENVLRDATAKLDEQEIFEAALEGDVPAIKRAMNSAAKRDSQLRRPKWQRGEVDPKLLARLGVGGLFAGTAYAVAPEEVKTQAAFAAGLAGLIIPGGGRVLNRMRQSGAVTLEGDIISLLAKQGKLKVGKSADEIIANEAELITRAKKGDQSAYKELYEENFPRITRYVRKFVRDAGPKLGLDAEDIAQEAFVSAFKGLDNFKGGSQFSTWLHTIARNKSLDAIREANNLKGGGEFSIQSADMSDVKTPHGESYTRDAFDEGAGADMLDTPENQALRQEVEQQLTHAIEKLPEAQKEAFILSRIEQYTAQEIADMKGENISTVLMRIKNAQDKIEESLAKGYGAKKETPTKATMNSDVVEPIKRGRGRPRKQTGEIDQRLLRLGGVAALGAGAGAFLNDENKALGAGIGILAGSVLMSKGRKGISVAKHITNAADYTLGVTSTRIMNKSKELWRKAIEHERTVLRDTHKHMEQVDPFLVRMEKLPKETQDILSRAMLTGKPGVTDKLLQAIGDQDLIRDWKKVRSTMDSLGDQLVKLERFKAKEVDYIPRIVNDVDGLVKALGREKGSYLETILNSAENDAIRNRGTGLSELERSLIVNKALVSDKITGQQPGFAKDRVVEEITPELQKFYAKPVESIHSFIRSAVEDINRAKFFGKDIQVIEKGGKKYTNVDISIGNVVQRLMSEGKLTGKDAEEVASLLKSRFLNGERAPNEVIQAAKNISYGGLLGSPFSAVTQFGDAIIQAYTQDIRSAMTAVVQNITGKKAVSLKDFGLSNHLAQEFASTSKSAKALNKIFKYSLFTGIDEFGKNVALNAAILRFGRLSKSESGVAKIAQRYGEALQPAEFKQLITDLQKGDVTDLVRSIAFAELSRTQPITKLELPQAYLDNPNGRFLYQFKTFMLKQIDLARRDAYNEIKAGHVARGIKNLVQLGIALGVAGTTTDKTKDFLLGKDVDLKASDVPMNMLKTFGLSEFVLDGALGVSKEEAKQRRKEGEKFVQAKEAKPFATAAGLFSPPAKMFDEIVRGDPKALRYIPLIGPILYEQNKAEKEKEKGK